MRPNALRVTVAGWSAHGASRLHGRSPLRRRRRLCAPGKADAGEEGAHACMNQQPELTTPLIEPELRALIAELSSDHAGLAAYHSLVTTVSASEARWQELRQQDVRVMRPLLKHLDRLAHNGA